MTSEDEAAAAWLLTVGTLEERIAVVFPIWWGISPDWCDFDEEHMLGFAAFVGEMVWCECQAQMNL